jgi:aspartyl-tRNA(Asn)/glutamyl-tRNA(Gln) amidotransferase subunit C
MPLTIEEVEHIAWLARLGLTQEEKARMAEQLSGILDHFKTLNELSTEEVSPTSHPLPLTNVMRPDTAGAPCDRDLLLGTGPQRDEQHLIVPRIVEE